MYWQSLHWGRIRSKISLTIRWHSYSEKVVATKGYSSDFIIEVFTLAKSSSFDNEWILSALAHFYALQSNTLNWVVKLPSGAIKTPNISIPIAGSMIKSFLGTLDK